MKIYLGKPKSKFFRGLLNNSLSLIFLWAVLHGEMWFRQQSDLQHTDQFCGSIVKYGYEKGGFRGLSTWRLYVVSAHSEKKVYKVGSPYLRNILDQQDMYKGRDVCVQSVPQLIDYGNNFISQILLDRVPILETKKVLKEYLSAPDIYIMSFYYICFTLAFISLIRIER